MSQTIETKSMIQRLSESILRVQAMSEAPLTESDIVEAIQDCTGVESDCMAAIVNQASQYEMLTSAYQKQLPPWAELSMCLLRSITADIDGARRVGQLYFSLTVNGRYQNEPICVNVSGHDLEAARIELGFKVQKAAEFIDYRAKSA